MGLTPTQRRWLESADRDGYIRLDGYGLGGRVRRTVDALLDRGLIRQVPAPAGTHRWRLSPLGEHTRRNLS